MRKPEKIFVVISLVGCVMIALGEPFGGFLLGVGIAALLVFRNNQ